MRTARGAWMAAILAAGGIGLLAGCEQQSLFSGPDPALRRLKYFDNESVQAQRETRRQAQEYGWGFSGGSSGPAQQ